eukprot:12866777-Ditylum_brightwellii.AAC.1
MGGKEQQTKQDDTAVSERDPKEYDCSTKNDLSIVTKRVQAARKCKFPQFKISSEITQFKEVSKEKSQRR